MNHSLINQLGAQAARECVPVYAENGSWTLPVSYAAALTKLVVLECSRVAKLEMKDNRVCDAIENHFGVSE